MKKLILFIAIVGLFGCKKKTTEPEPAPTTTGGTTGTPAATSKTVTMVAYQSGSFGPSTGTLQVNFDYNYIQPNPVTYTIATSTAICSITQYIPIEADSLLFGLQNAPGSTNYYLNYTVSVNGSAVKTGTHAQYGYVKY